MAEYKLSYTAKEIDEKLGKIKDYVSWNDLTDKPFGEVPGLVEIMPETAAFDFTDPTFGKAWMIQTAPTLVVGEAYTVVYNGVSYECVGYPAMDGFTDDPAAVCLGNFSVVGGENTGEPFAMLIMPKYQQIVTLDLVGSTSVTIAIKQSGMEIRKLDNRCLDLAWLPIITTSEKLIFEKENCEFSESSTIGNITVNRYQSDEALTLVGGQSYVVDWDGIEYNIICHERENDGVILKFLGNMAFLGFDMSNTGEPFCFYTAYLNGIYLLQIYVEDTNPNSDTQYHTFKIFSVAKNQYNKLPMEFLPDGVPYVADGMVEVLPECQPFYNGGGEYFITVTPTLVIGETYTVNWNGTKYECVGQDMSALMDGAVGLGNLSDFGGTGNGEPFALGAIQGEGTLFLSFNSTTELTVSIKQGGVEIRKLDSRCLPDNAVTVENILSVLPIYNGEVEAV